MSEIAQKISATVEASQEELLGLVRELVQIHTSTPPGHNYDVLVDKMLPYCRQMGFQAQRVDMPEEVFNRRCKAIYPLMDGVRSNLLATKKVGARLGVLWYAHFDTVPVEESQWSVPPYEGVVKEGRIWGRGVADAKGECACAIAAFRILHRLGIEPKYNVTVALTADEEIGPYSGLMYLADMGAFKDCQYFHSLDGGSEGIGIGANGALTWTIKVRGKSVHSGSSFLGVNPIEHSAVLVEELLRLKRKVQSRHSVMPVLPAVAEQTGYKHVIPVLNITMARGGVKHNIIPAEFIIEGDRRFIPEEDEAEVTKEIEEAVRRAKARDPQLDCELTVNPFYTSYLADAHHPWVQEVGRAVKLVTGRDVPAIGLGGSTDVAYTVKTTGMASASFGVGRHLESNNHGVDENARIEDLLNLVKVICLLAVQEVR